MPAATAHERDASGWGHDQQSFPRDLTAAMLGFGCDMDEEGQAVVKCVLQGSPAAYSGQVGIGDIIEAIDGRMVSSLPQLSDVASGPEDSLVALELRRRGDSHSESLHLMRQTPSYVSDVDNSNKSEKAGMGARVVHDVRGMRVCDLYEGSSSYWSTLKIDDIVCAVDGQDIRHGPPSLVLQLTNGSIGTGMCLHVIRKESSDDEIAGALSARGLGGGPSAHVNWKGAKAPELKSNERLTRVHVVRSRPLADIALARALAYRARVVDLLQKRIERALLDSNGSEIEEREDHDILLQDQERPHGTGNGSETVESTQLGVVAIPVESIERYLDTSLVQSDGKEHIEVSNMSERSWANEKLDSQLAQLQDKHEGEMRKLQEQIADLASVIKAVRQNSHPVTQDGDEEHEVHRGLMDCVDKMRLQQQEERKSMIALFQRHCQETMKSQELLAEALHGEILELREKDGENLEFKQKIQVLVEKVEQLNRNNVLIGNIPGKFAAVRELGAPSEPGNHQAVPYGDVSGLQLNDSKHSPVPALAMSRMYSAGPGVDTRSRLTDPAVGVSITISADFNRVQKHEKRFSEDLISACSWCLQAAEERFVYCLIERGSVIAKFNIIPDPSGMDPRPCRRLAEELAAQVAHPHSPVRKAPVTKPATKVDIHQPYMPKTYTPAHAQLQPVRELPIDDLVKFSQDNLSEPETVESPLAHGSEEEWSEEQKQEQLSAMNRRLEEMDAFVSNLAASAPGEATTMSVAKAESDLASSESIQSDRLSNAFPPERIPFKKVSMKSVMDLSVEEPTAEEPKEDNKSSRQHKAHMEANKTGKGGGYRRLPPSSAVELESVLSRLEHPKTFSLQVMHSPQELSRSRNLDASRMEESGSSSRSYAPTPNEFTSSFVIASSPQSAWKLRNANFGHQIAENGTLSPGSESSMNVSKRSPSPAEPKRWRLLPQWNEGNSLSTAKGTPRSEMSIGTPRSLSASQRIGKEQQTLLGMQPTVLLPSVEIDVSNPARAHAKHASQAKDIYAGQSQRGNSPNRRRRQFARSDSSSDDESGGQKRISPLSSVRSESSKQDDATDASKARISANAILNDSDSDEEVRVRASDLPVRRLVNQRFQK